MYVQRGFPTITKIPYGMPVLAKNRRLVIEETGFCEGSVCHSFVTILMRLCRGGPRCDEAREYDVDAPSESSSSEPDVGIWLYTSLACSMHK